MTLGPEPILFTGIERPDVVLITSADGRREVTGRGDLARLAPGALVIVDESVADGLPADRTLVLPLRATLTPKHAALGALAVWLSRAGIIEAGALDHALAEFGGDDAGPLREAVRRAASLP